MNWSRDSLMKVGYLTLHQVSLRAALECPPSISTNILKEGCLREVTANGGLAVVPSK